jgi:formate hydrogenlyase subunit 3/multisubunit Na+/H+ antiporter MnhD subunit
MTFGPLILIVAPLAAAVLAFVLRRFLTASALIAAVTPLGVAVWALQSPSGETVIILGRALALSDGDRVGIAFLFIASAAIFLGVWRSSPGWTYYPIVLVILSALAVALTAYHPLPGEIYPTFIYSALFVAMASALTVFPLQGGKPGVTSGVQRFITFTTLALPALLMADWTLNRLTQSPDSAQLKQATLSLVAAGFTFLLAIFPFHTWVPTASREAPPLSMAFVLSVLLGASLLLLLDVLNATRLIDDQPAVLELLRGAGVLMAGFSAALAWAHNDFGRLLSYGALADMGAMLFAVGLASSAGLAAAFVALIVRSISVGLMAMGLTLARERLGDDSFHTLTGLVWRLPWAALAIVAGGLSLAGLPPLAGFAGRWGLLQEASAFDPRAASVLLAASVSVAVGMLRGLREMLQPLKESVELQQAERRSEIVLIVAALALCLFVGLFPGALAPIVREFVASYTFVVR